MAAPSLNIKDNDGKLEIETKKSLHDRAQELEARTRVKYFETSTKCAPRE
jgi:hypothetical protein